MIEDELPDFSGKVVFVQLPAEGHNWLLADVRFERQAGHWVLLGTPLVEQEEHWARGTTVGIRWKYAAYYVVFDSLEDLRRRGWGKPVAPAESADPRHGWLKRWRQA